MIHRSALLVLALACPLAAQTNRFPVSESYDPASTFDPAYKPADVVVVNSTIFGGGGVQWAFGEMGLPDDANIDAFSDGSDIFPGPGPSIVIPPANCMAGGFLEVEYTVDPGSVGAGGSFVEDEASTDGAASDTFIGRWEGAATPTMRLGSDALGVAPLPMMTDLDALTYLERRRYPVYFSVDPPTAADLGLDPAAIYISIGTGAAPTELFSAAELGLGPGDDIDALAVRAHLGPPPTPTGRVVFSLSRTSPSAAPTGSLAAVTPGGLAGVASVGTAALWASPGLLELDPGMDNINGLRITDPVWQDLTDGSMIDMVTGDPWNTITIDNSGGNVARYVDTFVNQPFQVAIQPQHAGDAWIIFAQVGIPDCQFAFQLFGMPTPMNVNPGFAIAYAAGAGFAQVPVLFNFEVDIAIQGIVVEAGSGQGQTTNMVVARVH